MKFKYKRYLAIVLVFVMAFSLLCVSSCDEKDKDTEQIGDIVPTKDGVYEISFAKANSIEEMKQYDGKKVSIMGYMSTLSPINGEFMYLMNMPYQSCPFCEPDSTKLSNTIAVYSKNGKPFEFNDLLIKVEGTLEFGDYVDEYEYEYEYRIKDATYKTIDTEDIPEKLKLWQQLAASGVVAEINNDMYDYIHFVCFWGTYTMPFDGVVDYLYPNDAILILTTDGAQLNYGYKDGYFDNLIAKIEAVDKDAFQALEDNIRAAETFVREAEKSLLAGEYEAFSEYSGQFGDGRKQYRMNNAEQYSTKMQALYSEFAAWLSEWEL